MDIRKPEDLYPLVEDLIIRLGREGGEHVMSRVFLRSLACLAFCFLILPSCKQSVQIAVPEQKVDFIGRWSEGSNFFELERDGRVDLEIDGPAESRLVRTGSLRNFDGQSICIGVGEWQPAKCLVISQVPYRSGGREVILLGGVELERE